MPVYAPRLTACWKPASAVRHPGFEEADWRANDRVPIMYLHQWEGHEVLYLNLGHARGHYDMQPMMDYLPGYRTRQLETARVL